MPASPTRTRMTSQMSPLFSGENGQSTNEVDLLRQTSNSKSKRPAVIVDETNSSRKPFGHFLQRSKRLFLSRYHGLSRTVKRASKRGRETLLRLPKTPSRVSSRHITLNIDRITPLIDDRTGDVHIDNTVRSSRYTAWNFLPLQLVAQFSKLANIYFLCVSIVQLIPSLSTTGRYTTLVPLLIFVGISMLREATYDIRRSRLDKEENNKTVSIFRARGATKGHFPAETGLWVDSKWQDVEVGDILRVRRDQAVPADIVLLDVDGGNGAAYIETAALDGETTLKSRFAPSLLASMSNHAGESWRSDAHFVVEHPNADLYNFAGNISIADETVPLTNSEIIYRGSTLRNTAQITGMAIYTGEECKIRKNATKSPRVKAPTLQVAVNRVIVIVACFVVILTLINTIAYQIWKKEARGRAYYLAQAGVGFFQLLASYFLMFNPIIPLALYISLEVVKAAQSDMMMLDIEMYDEKSDRPLEPRTSTIHEELGQVSYIFSDKTGTLTTNSMWFRKMSVAGTIWRHEASLCQQAAAQCKDPTPSQKTREHSQQISVCESSQIPTSRTQSSSLGVVSVIGSETDTQYHHTLPHGPTTNEMLEGIQSKPNTDLSSRIQFFLLAIALCHQCLPETGLDGMGTFQGASPDELALVRAAHDLGYSILERTPESITIRITQKGTTSSHIDKIYKILDLIEFSSDRRRMSIVFRMPDGRICLFCKGADAVIRSRLRLSCPIIRPSSQIGNPGLPEDQIDSAAVDRPNLNDDLLVEKCFQHVNDFASEGLRTLVYACKHIDELTYVKWKRVYHEATISLVNRESLIREAADRLEQDLELLGATGIEDRLQEGVPETIDKLHRAGLRIWMLTGDKLETAINVGTACGLIKDSSKLIVLADESIVGKQERIEAEIASLEAGRVSHSALAIEGQVLAAIECSPSERDLFLDLVILVDSVICCRTSPSQKATLVKLLHQKTSKAVILAIGDGANDIAMIQEAHIGIGITGQEGMQAARASDYSIAQFRFLQRLLLVHGHWNYMRTCKYVLGTFWKEMLLYLTQALFQRWNGYTGTSLYEPWSLTLFQPLFTCLPVMFMGIYEKDLEASTLLAIPELYAVGQRNGLFDFKLFVWWIFMAAAEAVIIFFTMLGLYGEATITKDNGLYATGALTFTACIILISVKMQVLELHNKNIMAVIAVVVSLGAWFIWMLAISAAYTDNTIYNVKDGFLARFGRDVSWWLTLIAIIVAVVAFEIVVSTLRRRLWPTNVDIFQEYEQDPEFRTRILEGAGRYRATASRPRTFAEELPRMEG